MFALVICRGETSKKAELLFDLVTSEAKARDGKAELIWTNKSLKEAIRLIIYYSEILPKQYIQHYKDDNISIKIQFQEKKYARTKSIKAK